MKLKFYVQPAGSPKWCQFDITRTTSASYITTCGARIDATEILFLAQHPPGPVCSACRCPRTGDVFAGQSTLVSKVKVDMMSVADPTETSEYLAYEVIPGEPTVVVDMKDMDEEIEEAVTAIREWGGS